MIEREAAATRLLQASATHTYDPVVEINRLDPRSRHAQYALTEIGDECRHSIMFGRMIEKLGTPHYGPGKVEERLGRFLRSTAGGIQIFAAALIAEEILDALQREAMADESVQPLVRMVSRIHVVEEARHIGFARAELARQVAAVGPCAGRTPAS